MAKRKKKMNTLKASLKYELYGIVILILSVIALSQEGRVARSLTYLFRFLIGTSDWVIPIIFIYIGLFVMMKRAWPTAWSPWKTGLFLGLLGWMLFNHMSMIRLLDPHSDLINPSYIIGDTWTSMVKGLHPTGNEPDILKKEVGGGMIGALLYASLYFLFGNVGSTIIMVAMFMISFILITGISFVDIGMKLRGQSSEVQLGIKQRLLQFFSPSNPSKTTNSTRSKRKQIPYIPDHDDFEEENYVPELKKTPKTPVFFQLLQSSNKNTVVELTKQEPVQFSAVDALYKKPIVETIPPIPTIHDFQDHVEETTVIPKTESILLDENMELANANLVEKPNPRPYQLPAYHILTKPVNSGKSGEHSDYTANARKLEATLESFGVRAKVLAVVRGPTVTRYEIQPDVGVKVSRIVSLTDDIALALAAKDIRMEAPIPGKAAIGIEVPNLEVSIVTLREVMETTAFNDSSSKLSIVLGRDISGQPIVGNLAKMPHLLVAGATGSGKSVCINGIITSILFKAKPDEVKFLMIDPKMVELNVYNGIPHLLAPVVTDPRRASLALKKVVIEMEKRYELFSKSGTRNIEGYNAMIADKNNPNPAAPMPLIVVIVDELADLMMVASNDVEDAICRLAQMARASGIHLIIATQRPSVDVITGTIKANIPSRISFSVSSQIDSRTILDMAGAEKLLGQGDMLFLPVGASKPVRIQGAFLSDQEVESVVSFVSNQEKAQYQPDLVPEVDDQLEAIMPYEDEVYEQAVQIILEAKQASVSLLQRRMRIGYTRAARLIDTMEANGVVGPYEGSKPREVLLSLEQFHHNRMSS